uniref:Ig-like domain-containing protein n=1 Tax=Sus scrofa TaxID=9823 RepID=A0A8D1PYH9_PIG
RLLNVCLLSSNPFLLRLLFLMVAVAAFISCRHRDLVQPTMTVSPARTEALNQTLLVCLVTNFSPRQVRVRWFQNTQETVRAVFTALIQNGDWTSQTHMMLEITPQPGEIYICHGEHPSLQGPITGEWLLLPRGTV